MDGLLLFAHGARDPAWARPFEAVAQRLRESRPQTPLVLAFLEFIHNLVETLDKYFENVCELDIMFNIEKAHFILDEMVMSGYITETNKANILAPVIAVVKQDGK